jgi:hypothetical protein
MQTGMGYAPRNGILRAMTKLLTEVLRVTIERFPLGQTRASSSAGELPLPLMTGCLILLYVGKVISLGSSRSQFLVAELLARRSWRILRGVINCSHP